MISSQSKTLVFVGAHPDDETFGIGATLAEYTLRGVKVYYLCATRGEAGIADSSFVQGYATPGDMRSAELECAAKVLGLAGVIHLGYRDSGMPGSADNRHPQALFVAPLEEVTECIIKVLRQLRPQVIVTFDPIGGYRHPDHIAVHQATVKAFHACGVPSQYPEAGPAFSPEKLYFHVLPRGILRLVLKLLPLVGQDPHRLGRNKDIDLASVAAVQFPVHVAVPLSKPAILVYDKAVACHASQLGGRPRRSGPLGLVYRLSGHRHDYYMQGYPPVAGRKKGNDLFEGVA